MIPRIKLMTPKQVVLTLLTLGVVMFFGYSLLASWNQPQVQNQLELRATHLLLHVAELQHQKTKGLKPQTSADRTNLPENRFFGAELFPQALDKYQETIGSTQNLLKKNRSQLERLKVSEALNAAGHENKRVVESRSGQHTWQQQLKTAIAQQEGWLNTLHLQLGLLQVQTGEQEAALQTWTDLIDAAEVSASSQVRQTAEVLIGFWSDPPRLLPDAEQKVQQSLNGWFRYRALSQLYQLQQRQESLTTLQSQERAISQQAMVKLAVLNGLPATGGIVGVALLLFLIGQRLLLGQQSLLAQNADRGWAVPWNGETIWQVLVIGFFSVSFVVGLVVVPLLFQILQLSPAADARLQAFEVLLSYIFVAAGGLYVLYQSIAPFLPLSKEAEWFQVNWQPRRWIGWGVGGYLVALPLVLVVSLVNQQLWQGQGGNNPILPIALESQDGVALTIFALTATIAAPLFEEILFRGFLLPSLTRYLPVWGAIALSSLLFACAHLSLSEVVPLATLGIVLGIVYTRSRNLLAPILLHSLWNSGTMLSLIILGSSA